MKNRYVLGSVKVSFAWFNLKVLFSTPVWSARNRSTTIRFSRGVRNLAVTGESGRKMNMTIPQTQQRAPLKLDQHTYSAITGMTPTVTYMMMNSYFQDGSEPLMWPIPNPNNPPPAIPIPFAAYHKPIRMGCARLGCHIAVISIKLGSLQASAAPPSARKTARVLKLLQAAWSMRKNPLRIISIYDRSFGPCIQDSYHMKMLMPRYLAITRLVRLIDHRRYSTIVLTNWKPLHQQICRDRPKQEAEIENR